MAPCPLSVAAKEELTWWSDQLTKWNGKSLVLRNPDLLLTILFAALSYRERLSSAFRLARWSTSENKDGMKSGEVL